MSFILDALKKSESERQQQAGAEFSDVPSGSGNAPSFKWLWILAVILLFNLVVLLGIFFRPNGVREPAVAPPPAETPAPEPAPEAAPEARNEPTFEDRIAAAKSSQPAAIVAEDEAPATTDPVPVAAETSTADPPPRYIKTLDELRLEGALQIKDLHLDIHVYADVPAERFVFINMVKHKENTRLAEGPVVKEITTDGVVLEHEGLTFLLPRE